MSNKERLQKEASFWPFCSYSEWREGLEGGKGGEAKSWVVLGQLTYIVVHFVDAVFVSIVVTLAQTLG